MITYSSGKFRDVNNGETSIKLREVTDSTKLHTLLKVIEGASTASLISARFEAPETSPVAPGADSLVGRVAILTLKDDNGQLYKVSVPSVNPTLVEIGDNPKNQRLNATQCAAIATAYGTATGKTGVTCIASRVVQKSYQ